MTTQPTGDIAAHRLSSTQLSCEFADIAPLLDPTAAAAAASRCHYCYDAPCVQACPTQIDIPSFIRKIGNGNLKGAATDILSANPLGGMCPRVSDRDPVRRRACATRMRSPSRSALQRQTDWAMETGAVRFTRAPDTGREVAVVGGPGRVRTGSRSPGTASRCSTRVRRAAASTNTGSPRTRPSTISRSVKSSGCCRWAASRCKPASRWAATSRSTRCASSTTRCFSRWGRRRACAVDRRRATERRDERGRLHRAGAAGRCAGERGGRAARGGDRRRQYGHRCGGAEPQARRRARDDGVPARRGGDERDVGGARVRAEERRHARHACEAGADGGENGR